MFAPPNWTQITLVWICAVVVWLSWLSGSFQYQRPAVRILSSAKIYLYWTVNCVMKKNENKEKEAGNGPFKKNSRVKLLLLGLSLLKVRRFQFGLFFYLFQIFLLILFLSVALSNIFDGTVWPDGFYSFRYTFTTKKKCPIVYKIYQSQSQFLPNTKKPS